MFQRRCRLPSFLEGGAIEYVCACVCVLGRRPAGELVSAGGCVLTATLKPNMPKDIVTCVSVKAFANLKSSGSG